MCWVWFWFGFFGFHSFVIGDYPKYKMLMWLFCLLLFSAHGFKNELNLNI